MNQYERCPHGTYGGCIGCVSQESTRAAVQHARDVASDWEELKRFREREPLVQALIETCLNHDKQYQDIQLATEAVDRFKIGGEVTVHVTPLTREQYEAKMAEPTDDDGSGYARVKKDGGE